MSSEVMSTRWCHKKKKRKLDDKAVKMKFVGYDDEAKVYRLIDDIYRIHISREVKFLESCKPFM